MPQRIRSLTQRLIGWFNPQPTKQVYPDTKFCIDLYAVVQSISQTRLEVQVPAAYEKTDDERNGIIMNLEFDSGMNNTYEIGEQIIVSAHIDCKKVWRVCKIER